MKVGVHEYKCFYSITAEEIINIDEADFSYMFSFRLEL